MSLLFLLVLTSPNYAPIYFVIFSSTFLSTFMKSPRSAFEECGFQYSCVASTCMMQEIHMFSSHTESLVLCGVESFWAVLWTASEFGKFITCLTSF